MANLNKQTPVAGVRYNPNSEAEDLDQVIASNWELLRRVPAFQAVATEWIASEEFRFAHVKERKAYKDNVYARCALDWMLTPEQRFRLAQYQKESRCFFWRPEENYGPIVVEMHLELLAGGIKDGIDDLCQVSPDPNPGGILKFNQPWPATPPKFRSQFAAIFKDDDLKEIDLAECSLVLVRVGNYLTRDKLISPEEKLTLGRYLFQLGDHFHRLGVDYKIAAIRRHQFYSERLIDEILAKIKKSLPYESKSGYDSDSKRSFLGTRQQWDKFLTWEAHAGSAYRAAAEYLPKTQPEAIKRQRKRGDPSRSEKQRDIAASIRQAVRAIQKWYPKIYPVRDPRPNSLHQPRA